MTTALENAMRLERNKFAAETEDLTPMEQGYVDALRKLGYEANRSQVAKMDPAKRQAAPKGTVTPGTPRRVPEGIVTPGTPRRVPEGIVTPGMPKRIQ